jgi:hypothetical protein
LFDLLVLDAEVFGPPGLEVTVRGLAELRSAIGRLALAVVRGLN